MHEGDRVRRPGDPTIYLVGQRLEPGDHGPRWTIYIHPRINAQFDVDEIDLTHADGE